MLNRFAPKIAVIAGSVFLTASVFADSIFPGADPGPGWGQFSAVMLSCGILLAGLKRARHFLWNDLPVILMNALVFFLLLDSIAFLISRRMAAQTPVEDLPIERAIVDFTPPPSCFYPFVLIRLQPDYSVPGVNTDAQGFRITPGAEDKDGAIEVHVYGGSTAYGWFLADSSTLAACLQRDLSAVPGLNVLVSNRAAATRNSTQSMMEFILALQAGDTPGAAVFYEGYNDAATAWYEADPGAHLGLRRLKNLLAPRIETTAARWSAVHDISLLRLAVMMLPDDDSAPGLIESEPLGRGMDRSLLAEAVLEVFHSNCRQIRAIAGVFDVPVVILWQPTLAGEPRPLFRQEQYSLDRMDPGEVDYQRAVWYLAGNDDRGDYIWLGDAAAMADSFVYNDYCHMNEYGTRLVSEAVMEILLPILEGEN